ncbi:MAG: vWA domain-containing protein, partial [Burkholderiales bacterium]
MELSFGTPWAVALLFFIPLLWYAAMRSRTNLARRHLYIVTAIRSIGLALLALALARPTWHSDSQDVCVAYALDLSRSISPGFIAEALDWIDQAQAQANPAQARIVAFADRPVVVQTTNDVRGLKVTEFGGDAASIDRSATDIERALDAALTVLDRNRVKRIVLLSDGNATDGDPWRIVPRLKDAGVRVFTIAAKMRDERDAWIDGIEVPAGLRDGEPFAAIVRVFSPGPLPARVRLRSGSQTLGSRHLQLAP